MVNVSLFSCYHPVTDTLSRGKRERESSNSKTLFSKDFKIKFERDRQTDKQTDRKKEIKKEEKDEEEEICYQNAQTEFFYK